MPWYYIIVQQIGNWNISVEAEDEETATTLALEQVEDISPDFFYKPEITDIQEVTKHVE